MGISTSLLVPFTFAPYLNMANKDKVQTDIRGGNKPIPLKCKRPKAKSNLSLIKQINTNNKGNKS